MNEIECQRLYKIAAVAKSFYDFGSSTFEKLRKWVSVGILKLRAVYPLGKFGSWRKTGNHCAGNYHLVAELGDLFSNRDAHLHLGCLLS